MKSVAKERVRHRGESYFWIGVPLRTPLGAGLFATTIEVDSELPAAAVSVEGALPDYFAVRALDEEFAARLLGSLRARLIAVSERERDVVIRDHQIELWCAGELDALAEETAIASATELAEVIDASAERLGYAAWRRRLHSRWARHAERHGLAFDAARLTLRGVLHTASGYRGSRERHVEASASLDLGNGRPQVLVVARLAAPAAEDATLSAGDVLCEGLPEGTEVVIAKRALRVRFAGGDDIASQLESAANIAAALDRGSSGDVLPPSSARPAAPEVTPPKNDPSGPLLSRRARQYGLVAAIFVGGYYAYSYTFDAVFAGTWRYGDVHGAPEGRDVGATTALPRTAAPNTEARACAELCGRIAACVGSMPETCRAGCADMTSRCRSCLDAIEGCRFDACDEACGAADADAVTEE